MCFVSWPMTLKMGITAMGRTRPYKEVRAKIAARRKAGRPARADAPPNLPRERVALPADLPGVRVPTVGRIVLVARTTGPAVPAIVTQVHVALYEDEPPTVSLVVFDAMHGENALPAEALRWVRYGMQPGNWTWPVRT
jgi:hypothetical protein